MQTKTEEKTGETLSDRPLVGGYFALTPELGNVTKEEMDAKCCLDPDWIKRGHQQYVDAVDELDHYINAPPGMPEIRQEYHLPKK